MYEANTEINNIFKALGHKIRTDILEIVYKEKNGITLKQIEKLFNSSLQNIAFHVSVMKRAKLFKTRKKDTAIYLMVDKKRLKLVEKFMKTFSN